MMESQELNHVLAAILTFSIIMSLSSLIKGDFSFFPQAIFFSSLIIVVSVFSKKLMANALDSDVEHEIISWRRYGLYPHWHFRKELPGGLIFPLFFSIFSLGMLKIPLIMSYESRALKQRAAKRFGYYSYTEMTDWHHALIGAAGTIALFVLSLIAYFLPLNLEYLATMSSAYAFFNMIPVGKLDGAQIFFGSKVLWVILAAISLIFFAYSLPLYL